ncbi:MAG: cytochrome b5 domain-containing protein [Candidatus Woesearchaeota archaeon]
MKYFILIIMIAVSIFIVGCSSSETYSNSNVNNLDTNTNTTSVIEIGTTTTGKTMISLSELQKHNTESDCWIAYEGTVYDVTSFLPMHPGGSSAIGVNCGTSEQFEEAFTQQHGTSKVRMLEKQGTYKGMLE